MTKAAEKLLLDIVGELQQLSVQVNTLTQELRTVKAEVVLTVRATPRKRKRRRRGMPTHSPQ